MVPATSAPSDLAFPGGLICRLLILLAPLPPGLEQSFLQILRGCPDRQARFDAGHGHQPEGAAVGSGAASCLSRSSSAMRVDQTSHDSVGFPFAAALRCQTHQAKNAVSSLRIIAERSSKLISARAFMRASLASPLAPRSASCICRTPAIRRADRGKPKRRSKAISSAVHLNRRVMMVVSDSSVNVYVSFSRGRGMGASGGECSDAP